MAVEPLWYHFWTFNIFELFEGFYCWNHCFFIFFFFLILFFKGPQFKDKLPFSNLKCPFFCRILLNQSKKLLFIGRLTSKTLAKQHASTENTLWGQFPTFSTKMFSSFFRYYDKLIEESSQRKKNMSPIKLWVFDP